MKSWKCQCPLLQNAKMPICNNAFHQIWGRCQSGLLTSCCNPRDALCRVQSVLQWLDTSSVPMTMSSEQYLLCISRHWANLNQKDKEVEENTLFYRSETCPKSTSFYRSETCLANPTLNRPPPIMPKHELQNGRFLPCSKLPQMLLAPFGPEKSSCFISNSIQYSNKIQARTSLWSYFRGP